MTGNKAVDLANLFRGGNERDQQLTLPLVRHRSDLLLGDTSVA
jgi:hypothetical protein